VCLLHDTTTASTTTSTTTTAAVKCAGYKQDVGAFTIKKEMLTVTQPGIAKKRLNCHKSDCEGKTSEKFTSTAAAANELVCLCVCVCVFVGSRRQRHR